MKRYDLPFLVIQFNTLEHLTLITQLKTSIAENPTIKKVLFIVHMDRRAKDITRVTKNIGLNFWHDWDNCVIEDINKSNYKVALSSNIVIAGAISNPGPTAMEGTYKRTSNGVLIEIKKVFDGVYVIDNPGGAGVPPFPYLLYNHRNSSGGDSLAFPIQTNPCGGGLQLVGPSAALSLSSAEYTASYPPAITATSPLTFSWKVLEFPEARPGSVNPGAAACQWGTGVRTFEKQ